MKIFNLNLVLFFSFLSLSAFAQETPSPTVPQEPPAAPAPAKNELPQKKTPLTPIKPLSLADFQVQPHVLKFRPEKNGVKVIGPQLSFGIDRAEDMVISGATFNPTTFQALITPMKNLGIPAGIPYGPNTMVLFITAPMALGTSGTLEVVGESGQVLAEREFSKEQFNQGSLLAKTLSNNFWKDVNPQEQTSALLSAEKMKRALMGMNMKSGYRFCWKKADSEYFFKACTPYYRYSNKDRTLKLQIQSGSTKVFLDQKETSTEALVEIKPETPVRFLAVSKQGFTVEFFSKPNSLNLLDFAYEETKKAYFFTGHSNIPTFPETRFFPGVDPKSLTAKLQWQATIAAPKDFWVSMMPSNKTYFIVPGAGGGLFRYNLEISKAPTALSKITLINPPLSTYSSRPAIKGASINGGQFKAAPPGKLNLVSNTNNFTWEFPADVKGEEQDGGLIATENNQNFTAYYNLFRGYSGEFSFRLAGVLSKDMQLNLLNEFAYNQWFETLLGLESPLLSKQRWGVSAKRLSSLKTFQPNGGTGTPLSLGLTTVDMKYRFTPGLWERDETWGLILGFEDITITDIKGSFAGTGLFWARSMPLVFDRIISWFPYMNYPKWVDMELVYYVLPLTSGVKTTPNPNYALNFHGKVLWKKYFFGEAGFGIKAYNYSVGKSNVNVQALYGTAGLGLNF
ncbi:MAG: hypothetical protein RJB66_2668 [Pseudomonadota bacterium]|jgi:hypothetical protein